jgi:hypothetical protein
MVIKRQKINKEIKMYNFKFTSYFVKDKREEGKLSHKVNVRIFKDNEITPIYKGSAIKNYKSKDTALQEKMNAIINALENLSEKREWEIFSCWRDTLSKKEKSSKIVI